MVFWMLKVRLLIGQPPSVGLAAFRHLRTSHLEISTKLPSETPLSNTDNALSGAYPFCYRRGRQAAYCDLSAWLDRGMNGSTEQS
jgi:hypothetical protein